MGFFFFALAEAGRQENNRKMYWLGIGLTLSSGIPLSIARMAAGGHFLTDTLFAALIMYTLPKLIAPFIWTHQTQKGLS